MKFNIGQCFGSLVCPYTKICAYFECVDYFCVRAVVRVFSTVLNSFGSNVRLDLQNLCFPSSFFTLTICLLFLFLSDLELFDEKSISGIYCSSLL